MALFHLFGSLGAAFITYLLGKLGDKYDIKTYPERSGYILGTAVIAAYLICAPFFIIAGHKYAKVLKKKIIIKDAI